MATETRPRRPLTGAEADPDHLAELRRRLDEDTDVLLRFLVDRRHEWLAEGEDLTNLQLG